MSENKHEINWGTNICTKKANFYLNNTIGKVLDYGCGYGDYGKLIAKEKKLDVYFADVDKKFLDKIDFPEDRKYLLSLDSLDFRENQFDTILLGDVIEHVENLEKFWSEVSRVTSSKISISVPRRETPGFLKTLGLTWRAYEDLTHKRYFEALDLQGLVNDKFTKVEVLPYYPRKKLNPVFDLFETIGYFPGFLAIFTSNTSDKFI